MAHVLTALPTHTGELQVAKQLKTFPDDLLHLWFSLSIPGVKDVDIVLWHEKAGIFVIEVKAVPLRAIEVFGWQMCKVTDRDVDRGPQQQAHTALHSLRNFVTPFTGKIFMTSVACFPKIHRAEWNSWWDDKRVVGDYADSMLFYDDLHSEPEALVDRLNHIRTNPNVSAEKQLYFHHNQQQFEAMVKALCVESKPKPTVSDMERLRIIETTVRNEEKKLVAPFSGLNFFYTGAPGTGKTFRLLKVAHQHALEGAKVLFVCFNKVLGADIKRLLSFSQRLVLVDGVVEVHDVWEMISLFISKTSHRGEEFDDWAELVVAEMRQQRATLTQFDTILVDEAQDLKQWAFDMIELHAKKSATICIASGSGQELYGKSSEFLMKFAERAKKRSLRRCFRNTEAATKFAYTAYEADWDCSKISKALSKFDSSSGTEYEFARPGGELPFLVTIDDEELENVSEAFYPDMQNELMTSEYRRIIRAEIDNLDERQRPTDLLILVPSPSSNQRRWAIEALVGENLPYLDYTDVEKRRCFAPADQIRVCTFHSARGLEGQRVIVFGIEQLFGLAEAVKAEPRNLGYITLSRAVLDMVIVYRPSVQSRVLTFLHTVLTQMRIQLSPIAR